LNLISETDRGQISDHLHSPPPDDYDYPAGIIDIDRRDGFDKDW
jgi:hypothetical protein